MPEVDEFTLEVLKDTCVTVELALPCGSEGPEFVKGTKRIRDNDGIPIWESNNACWMPRFTKLNTSMDTQFPSLQTRHHRICSRKLVKRETKMCYLIKSQSVEPMERTGRFHQILFRKSKKKRYNKRLMLISAMERLECNLGGDKGHEKVLSSTGCRVLHHI